MLWHVRYSLIIAIVLRQPASQALSHKPLNKVKAGPFEVEWDRMAAETEKEVEAIGISANDAGAIPAALREELTGEAASAPAALAAAVRVAGLTTRAWPSCGPLHPSITLNLYSVFAYHASGLLAAVVL